MRRTSGHHDDEPSGEDLARDEAEARAWRREQLAQRTVRIGGWAHILPSAPASTGSDTPPKDGDPRATQPGAPSGAPATDPSCAAETPAGASRQGARPPAPLPLVPSVEARQRQGASHVDQDPAARLADTPPAGASLPSTPAVGNTPAADARPASAAGNSARTC